VFSFLQKVFDHKNYDYTITVTNGLRAAYLSKVIDMCAENINKTWYYGYIAHFNRQHKDVCKEILNEYNELAKSMAINDTFLHEMIQLESQCSPEN
jgi:hypothetical protein